MKNFDQWNNVKKKLDLKNHALFFYEKEIWWCSIGINVGSEEDGKSDIFVRPVLIYRKINRNTFLGIPLTKVLREDSLHASFYFEYDFSTALISQIRIFDRKRLVHRMGNISDYVFVKMKKAVIAFVS